MVCCYERICGKCPQRRGSINKNIVKVFSQGSNDLFQLVWPEQDVFAILEFVVSIRPLKTHRANIWTKASASICFLFTIRYIEYIAIGMNVRASNGFLKGILPHYCIVCRPLFEWCFIPE